MATRSIKLKLSIGGEENKHLRQAVWSTHRLFNEGVAYYMNWMIRLRQRPIGDEITGVEILPLARAAQVSNGALDKPGSDEEITRLLRTLYEEIVPSSIGNKGDANQISRNYHSILVDPTSVGGLGQSSGGRKPAWMSMPEGPEKEEKRKAWEERKRDSENMARPLLKKLGVLPLFPAFNKTKPRWTRAKGEDQNAILTKGDRDMFQQALERLKPWERWNRRVMEERKKKEKALQDIKEKYFNPEPDWHKRLRKYEALREQELGRDAFRPESPFRLGNRSIRGWADLRDKWLKVSKGERSEETLLKILADLQTERRGGFGDASHFYRWLAKPENHFLWDTSSNGDCIRQHVSLNEAQRSFDEAKLFADYTPPDALEHPLWARSGHSGDSNLHKYHIQEKDGSLTATIRLMFENTDGDITERNADIPVRPTGQWNQPQRGTTPPLQIIPFHKVPKEFHSGKKNDKESTWILYTDPGSGEQSYGTLGGARLQVDRDDFKLGSPKSKPKREEDFADASKMFPRAYLNVTISLPDPPENGARTSLLRTNSGETDPLVAVDYNLRGDKKKHALEDIRLGGATMVEGMRVMAVDLGVRQLAACSVFELVNKPDGKKFTIPVAGTDDLYMEHRRSFLLQLPGEKEDANVKIIREEIISERLLLRSANRRLADLLSLGRHDDPEKKKKALEALKGVDTHEKPERRQLIDEILDPTLLDRLLVFLDKQSDPRWPDEVLKIHRIWEKALGLKIQNWRRKGRESGRLGRRRGYGGLSFWHVQELEETRKFLNAWSCHSREYTDVNGNRRPLVVRAKKRFGLKAGEIAEGQDIDARLLSHINRLKEDRLKQGADLLVMAALGYEYCGPQRGWEHRHPPCQLILFEDLTRYRFKTDRPRRENSMLMKWSHREIPRTVAMQGEVSGLVIGTVAAEFSSKYRASGPTQTPGIRCRKVTRQDLEEKWFQDAIKREIEKGRLRETPIPNDYIPWDLGEYFCTLNPDGRLFVTNADINAAQNLMRRFWRRYSETFRVSCRGTTDRKTGQDCWIPKNLSKRLPRALKYDFGMEALRFDPIDPNNHEKGFLHTPISMADYRTLGGKKSAKTATTTEDAGEEIAAMEEEIEEARGTVLTLFRDPSGVIIPSHNGRDVWLPAKVFWGRVNEKIRAKLATGTLIFEDGQEDDDINF